MSADPVEKLNVDDLRRVVREVRSVLWLDPDSNRWECDREWRSDTIEDVARALELEGLRPPDLRVSATVEEIESTFIHLIWTEQGRERLKDVLAYLATLTQEIHPAALRARTQFIDRLAYLDGYGGTVSDTNTRRRFEVILGSDMYPMSFTVTWKQLDRATGQYVYSMNGGLIWHGGPGDSGSVCLDAEVLWGIHT